MRIQFADISGWSGTPCGSPGPSKARRHSSANLSLRACPTASFWSRRSGSFSWPPTGPMVASFNLYRTAVTGSVAVALTALGFALTLWARYILGSNWSGNVTIKVGHELIRSGPYRFVRHPIYTGIISPPQEPPSPSIRPVASSRLHCSGRLHHQATQRGKIHAPDLRRAVCRVQPHHRCNLSSAPAPVNQSSGSVIQIFRAF